MDEIEEQVKEGGNIIDWHACDLFPKSWIDLVVVLRVDSATLYDRLKARYVAHAPFLCSHSYLQRSEKKNTNVCLPVSNYPELKLQENMDSEIMQVLLDEARESYDEEIIVELRSDSAEDVEGNVERIEAWVKQWLENNKGE